MKNLVFLLTLSLSLPTFGSVYCERAVDFAGKLVDLRVARGSKARAEAIVKAAGVDINSDELLRYIVDEAYSGELNRRDQLGIDIKKFTTEINVMTKCYELNGEVL